MCQLTWKEWENTQLQFLKSIEQCAKIIFCESKKNIYIYSHFIYLCMCVCLSVYVLTLLNILRKATKKLLDIRERWQESELLEKGEIKTIFKISCLSILVIYLLVHVAFYFKGEIIF